MEKEVQVTVTDETKEVVIRHGQAAEIEKKQAVSLSGDFSSVIDFETKRRKQISEKDSHIIINTEKMEIIFVVNESDRVRHTVSGAMMLHPFIKEMHINEDHEYTIPGLLKLLKLNRRFFMTKTDHANMVKALSEFQAKTETTFVNSNDYKGSTAFSLVRKVTSEIPLEFQMKIPIFIGTEEREFQVKVEVVPDGTSLVCSLVSVELAEMMEEITKAEIQKVKSHFEKYVQIVQTK